jgi:hypothetical protein
VRLETPRARAFYLSSCSSAIRFSDWGPRIFGTISPESLRGRVTASESRSPTAPYPVSYGIASGCAARIQAPLPLQLHDIDDAERFVGAIVSRSGFSLSFHDAEDLGEYLLVECWQLSLRYQAGGISFSTYAGNTLRRRSVDWIRQQNGRTVWKFKDRIHERPRPALVSFDDDAERDRLVEAFGAGAGDGEADRDETLGRLLDDRDRERDRDWARLRRAARRRAA